MGAPTLCTGRVPLFTAPEICPRICEKVYSVVPQIWQPFCLLHVTDRFRIGRIGIPGHGSYGAYSMTQRGVGQHQKIKPPSTYPKVATWVTERGAVATGGDF